MNNNPSYQILSLLRRTGLRRGSFFGAILLIALLAFELFNFSTTDFALTDLLGKDLTFLGLRWATILSIAFCGIDFAGVARLFTPQVEASREPAEVWYLFGAWVLAAAMNASLTWWGVSIAISAHNSLGASLVSHATLLAVVPVFVAIMVWLIRLLIIGTFSMAGDRLFSMAGDTPSVRLPRYNTQTPSAHQDIYPNTPRPAPKPQPMPQRTIRPEPTYQPLGLAAKSREEEPSTWR